MRIITHRPRGALAGAVELLWHAEGPAPVHAAERVLPSGTAQLVVQLATEPLRVWPAGSSDRRDIPEAVMAGPHSRPFAIGTARHARLMGVHFRPGGSLPFFVGPANELHDRHVGLGALWGGSVEELRGRLIESCTPGARFRLLERFLLRRAARPLEPDPRIVFALRGFDSLPGQISVSQVAARLGLGPRSFARRFREHVGLGPKLYARVRRFQAALRRIETRGRGTRWTDLALGCGYFDQAHMIRDFKAFTGLTPGAYERLDIRHRNHVPADP